MISTTEESTVTQQNDTAPSRQVSRVAVRVGVLAVLVLLVVVLGRSAPGFFTFTNSLVVVRATAVTGIVALAATFVTISGNFFSLAIGQTAVFSGVIFGLALRGGSGFAVALLLTAVVAVLLGIVEGIVIAAGANPIVTTLGAGALIFGLAGLLSDSRAIVITNATAMAFGNGRPLGVPTQSWAFLVLIVVATVVLRRTVYGRNVLLCGSSREAAKATGLPVGRITVTVFVVASLGAALVGVFNACQFSAAKLDPFATLDIDVVAAILIGGTAVGGGKGSTVRTAAGALFISVVNNYLVLKGVTQGTQILVQGPLVLLCAIGFHVLRNSRNEGS